MRTPKAIAALAAIVAISLSTSVFAAEFSETFSTMPTGYCVPDGSVIGEWHFVYDGFGCNTFVSLNLDTVLRESPYPATTVGETHAGLVTGPAIAGDFTLQVSTVTTRQLRTGSTPNAWEVGWVLWNYTDDSHFYYFIAKPNGWELGKEDPAYPGSQRFLASASSPSFAIGNWYRIRVTQTANVIQVFANDLLITTFTDSQRPYSSGRIGLYTEDAETYYDNVSLTTNTSTPRGKGHKH